MKNNRIKKYPNLIPIISEKFFYDFNGKIMLEDETIFNIIIKIFYELSAKNSNIFVVKNEDIKAIKFNLIPNLLQIINKSNKYLSSDVFLLLSHNPTDFSIDFIFKLIENFSNELWKLHRNSISEALCSNYPLRRYFADKIFQKLLSLSESRPKRAKYLIYEFGNKS